MDYTKLKHEIKEMAEIAASVPEAFREKCFELLLTHLLSGKSGVTDTQRQPGLAEKTEVQPQQQGEMKIPTQLRVFMQKTGIAVEELTAILMVADGDVHFIKEPSQGNITEGQMQWALLIALKNCLLNDSLNVDPEDVRSICQEKGFYDGANFAANFKKNRYAKFFKGPMERQGDAQALTNEGQTELANVIRALSTSKQ